MITIRIAEDVGASIITVSGKSPVVDDTLTKRFREPVAVAIGVELHFPEVS